MLFETLQTITEVFLLTLLPGYFLVLAVFKDKHLDLGERILLSAVSSISLNTYLMYIGNLLFRIPIKTENIVIEITASSILFMAAYLIRLKELPYLYIEEFKTETVLKNASIAALICLNIVLTYSIHAGYGYPYLIDEWNHLTEAVKIIDTGNIDTGNIHLETGFHIFTAEVIEITGQDPEVICTYLPLLFTALASLAVYVSTNKITSSYVTGLLAMIFYAGLPNNVELKGSWFSLPSALAHCYIYTGIYISAEVFNKKRLTYLFLYILFISSLTVIHPSSMIYIQATTAAYFLINIRHMGGKVLYEAIALTLPTVMLFMPYFICNIGPQHVIELISNSFIKPAEETTKPLHILEAYSILPALIALTGLIHSRKDLKKRIFIAMLLTPAVNLILFHTWSQTVTASYTGNIYYILLTLAPLSAAGFYEIFYIIGHVVYSKPAIYVLALITVAAIAYITIQPKIMQQNKLYKLVDSDLYETVKWFEKNRGRHNIVLSRPEISAVIYPLSRNNPMSTFNTVNNKALEDNRRFFREDCEGKEKIIEEYNISHLILKKTDRVKCSNLKTIYIGRDFYIYEVVY